MNYAAAQAPVVQPDGSLLVNGSNQPLNSSGTAANLLNGIVYGGQDGISRGFYDPKKGQFGPRVGFAYDVFGTGKTSIRGGYGMGYGRMVFQAIYPAFGTNPPYNQNANILNSLISDGTAGATAAPTPQTLAIVPFKYRPAMLQTYSLTLEHQVTSGLIASLAYVGSLGRHLQTYNDFNFPLPVTSPSQSGCLAEGQSPTASYHFDPCINSGTSSPNYTRPYQGYGSMTNGQYDGGSHNYNALLSSVRYNGRGGSQVSVAYTYGKVLSTITGAGARQGNSIGTSSAQNPYDFSSQYGSPGYDFRNNITGTWVYNIPKVAIHNRVASFFTNDWGLAGLALHQSGFALSPGLAIGTAGLATRPNVVAPTHIRGHLDEWFDTSAYAAPDYGFFGNSRNGTIRGPGYTDVNASVLKTIPLESRFNLQFRAEAFNILNHPNFVSADTNYGSGTFGQVTSAGDPRILEFGLKLLF